MGVNRVTTADGEELINLMSDTVSETNLLENETAHAANGEAIVGKAKYINPNLIISSDFSINQRGQTKYVGSSETAIYSLDMWRLLGTAEVFNDYITISPEGSVYGYGAYSQTVLTENVGKPFTISALINDEMVIASGVCGPEYIEFTGDGWNLRFVSLDETRISVEFIVYKKIKVAKPKLEPGMIATPFVKPNPAVELVKCQWFFERIYIPISIGITAHTTWESTEGCVYTLEYKKKRGNPTIITASYGRFIDSLNQITVALTTFTPIMVTDERAAIISTFESVLSNRTIGWVDNFGYVDVSAEP